MTWGGRFAPSQGMAEEFRRSPGGFDTGYHRFMRYQMILRTCVFLLIGLGSAGVVVAGGDDTTAVNTVLDTFHRAASEADGKLYFSLFAPDAIFLGTDASERWTVEEFRAFAEPYFSKGRGWTYTPVERHVSILPGGRAARFDEILSNESYGTCRGTGVLVLTPEGWRISQYSLSIPIPNEAAREIVARIREFDDESHSDDVGTSNGG